MGSEMYSQLAGIPARVRADLAFERTFIGMDALVLIQTAAFSSCVVTVFTLVRFHSTVGSHVHFQFVFATEALTAHFTFMGLIT